MTKTKIYLRAIKQEQRDALALFDSNRQGAINNLITEVPAGSRIVWNPDRCSGIKKIVRIYSKFEKRNVFLKDPRRKLICRGFVLQLPKDIKAGEEEEYGIEYINNSGEKISIDPLIKITPPKP